MQPRDLTAPVLIAGMGPVGRTLADALNEFGIGYSAIERDQRRLTEAVADGYIAAFGDLSDPRLWEPVAMHGRRVSALTEPSYETVSELAPIALRRYPHLKGFAVVGDAAEADRFRELGLQAVVDRSLPPGLDLAAAVLRELGLEAASIETWMRQQQERMFASNVRPLAA